MIVLNGTLLTPAVFLSLVFAVLILAVLAAVAGTGGGSLFLPLFTIPLTDVHKAVPLSKTTVFGTAAGACLVNYTSAAGDLINYRMVTLIQPATLLGCIFGVLLNFWFPSAIITACMGVILGFSAYKTFEQANRIDAEATCKEQELTSSREVEQGLLSNVAKGDVFIGSRDIEAFQIMSPTTLSPPAVISTQVSSMSSDTPPLSPTGATARKRDAYLEPTGFDVVEVAAVLLCWAVNLTCLLNAGSPAALVCGSFTQKAWLWADIFFLVSFTVGTYLRLSTPSDRLVLGRVVAPVALSAERALLYTGLAFLAGLGAALLGIGGGLIKAPLLISIGLKPLSAVATSNFMILFTSSTNLVAYAAAGRLNLSDSLYFTPLTLIGGVTGVLYLRKYFTAPTTQSSLARLLGGTILLGALAMMSASLINRYLRNVSDERTMADACMSLHHRQSF